MTLNGIICIRTSVAGTLRSKSEAITKRVETCLERLIGLKIRNRPLYSNAGFLIGFLRIFKYGLFGYSTREDFTRKILCGGQMIGGSVYLKATVFIAHFRQHVPFLGLNPRFKMAGPQLALRAPFWASIESQ